ncbi:protein kinase domain-containing protein [Actinomadura hibisca]|uniref:protein kinase domain-containing protein n=1 Tax=Actinomadura hibisca TaxID=68565 RepID=UPI0008327ABB|nr:protein kinase [Actinomadura hibisca]
MAHPHLPGRVGPYRVVDRLGEGGMGTVYTGLGADGRKVAIKVIRREFAADPQYRARFQAEVAAAQRVRPFCTAPVLDADPAADPPYLVTEFVNGPSLDDAIAKDGPLRGADLEAVAVGIATALTAIHDAGVVHRDLKPANVLLSTFGPRVIDFGIARSTADVTRLTATGGIIGTPAFMSPEQLHGHPATPASDVFAWGATVAYAASGAEPFRGASLAVVVHRITTGEPDLSGLTGTLRTVVRQALAKDAAHRPTAQDILDRLISSGARTPQPAAAPTAPRPALAHGEAEALVERQYRQAAEAGDPAAMRNLGVILSQSGRTPEAEYWYQRAATQPASGPAYHPAPANHYPPAQKPRYNGAAIFALTFGLLSPFTCGLTSIPAIIAAHVGWSRLRDGEERGRWMCLTGLIVGWLMIGFMALLAFGASLPDEPGK